MYDNNRPLHWQMADEAQKQAKLVNTRCSYCENFHACGANIGTPCCGAFKPRDIYINKR